MLKLLRMLINNGFVVLALLVAVTLYLAYGPRADHPETGANADAPTQQRADTEAPSARVASARTEGQPSSAEPTRSDAAADTAPPAVTASAPDAPSPAGETETERAPSSAADATPESESVASAAPPQAPATAEPAGLDTKQTASHPEAGHTTSEQDAATDAPAQDVPTAEAEKPTRISDQAGQTAVMAADSARNTTTSQAARPAATDANASENPDAVRGLLFDPKRLDWQAVLRRFNGPQEALAAAAEAARAGDPQWAAAIYFSLLEVRPDADTAGRLGNLLWRLGDATWARRAWRYAARLLIREGRIDTARAFARNIRKVDPALAGEILFHLPQPTPTRPKKDTSAS